MRGDDTGRAPSARRFRFELDNALAQRVETCKARQLCIERSTRS